MPPGQALWAKDKIQSQPLPFDTMLELTAAAEVNGKRFDGVDLGLLGPHIDLMNFKDDDIKKTGR